jgi:LCP family protein required for cell wall assembly
MAAPETEPQRTGQPGGCLKRLLTIFGIALFPAGLLFVLYLVLPPGQTNILIAGVDARYGDGRAVRTDALMVVGINPGRLAVSVLSIPRDLYIETPGYGMQRVNAINVLGEMDEPGAGLDLLSEALEESFDITVDRTVRVDFRALEALIDSVGGIPVYVERSIVDPTYPTDDGGVTEVRFDSGWQHLDGDQALKYARTRHGDDDYARAGRQQQVISGFVQRAISPLTWPAVLNAINTHVETDLSLGDYVTLGLPVLLSGGQFHQLVIDRDYIRPGPGYSVPNFDALEPWLNDHLR